MVAKEKHPTQHSDCILHMCKRFLIHRKLVIAVFAAAVAVCAVLLPQVKVNYSMTDFLPSETASIISLKDMEDSFDGGVPNTRLYAEGIDLAQARRLASSLEELEGISSVIWLGTATDTTLPSNLQDEGVVDSWKTEKAICTPSSSTRPSGPRPSTKPARPLPKSGPSRCPSPETA